MSFRQLRPKDLLPLMFVHGGGGPEAAPDTHDDYIYENLACKALNCRGGSSWVAGWLQNTPFPAGPWDDVLADYHWCANHAIIKSEATQRKLPLLEDGSGGNGGGCSG